MKIDWKLSSNKLHTKITAKNILHYLSWADLSLEKMHFYFGHFHHHRCAPHQTGGKLISNRLFTMLHIRRKSIEIQISFVSSFWQTTHTVLLVSGKLKIQFKYLNVCWQKWLVSFSSWAHTLRVRGKENEFYKLIIMKI